MGGDPSKGYGFFSELHNQRQAGEIQEVCRLVARIKAHRRDEINTPEFRNYPINRHQRGRIRSLITSNKTISPFSTMAWHEVLADVLIARE